MHRLESCNAQRCWLTWKLHLRQMHIQIVGPCTCTLSRAAWPNSKPKIHLPMSCAVAKNISLLQFQETERKSLMLVGDVLSRLCLVLVAAMANTLVRQPITGVHFSSFKIFQWLLLFLSLANVCRTFRSCQTVFYWQVVQTHGSSTNL